MKILYVNIFMEKDGKTNSFTEKFNIKDVSRETRKK